MRTEQEVFDELAGLCASPGYAHAIAYLCSRDNMIRYAGEMKAEDMQHLFSKSRLIRTETSTLIGLMLKSPIDYTLPPPPVLEKYIEATEALLEEIHHAMSASFWQDIDPTKIAEAGFNPFTSGAALREPIFYGGESAYSFQYRDFSPAKYANDDPWLIANKGFSIQEARNIVFAVSRLQDEKAIAVMRAMRGKPQETWTFLPGNAFSVQEVADYGHIDPVIVDRVLSAFAVRPGATNEQFKALHDFNIANASPLIRMPDGNSCSSTSTASWKRCMKRRSTGWVLTRPLSAPPCRTAASSSSSSPLSACGRYSARRTCLPTSTSTNRRAPSSLKSMCWCCSAIAP